MRNRPILRDDRVKRQMDRVLEVFRSWKPKFRFKAPRAFSFASPAFRRKRNKETPKKSPSRGSSSVGNDEEEEDIENEVVETPEDLVISKSADQRSYFCYTTEDEDGSSASTGMSSLNLQDLPIAICQLRKEILDVLVRHGLLLRTEADEVYENPRDDINKRSSRTYLLNNFLWLPEHLRMGTCFVDFINFYCDDSEYLEELLTRKVRVSDEKGNPDSTQVKTMQLVKDLVDIVDRKYYSFCLGRVIQEDDISHCARCRACFDHRYWHCDHCDRCSLGMSIGVCEHCGYRDVAESSGDSDEISVGSVSELQ